ncbi:pentapeptide repeat-containing protein [Planomonospora alba]|uniref:pentapeptide repeat-containing protein n=1 Tax=Planomonospora alba TaxID=161354 RepID=UPI0031ED980D
MKVWQMLSRITLAIAAVAVALALVWVLGPGAAWVLEHFDGVRGLAGKDLAAALDAIRGRALAIATGLIALVAVYYTARNAATARRTFELGEQGHVTDRYTKAIEQLGSDKLDIRLGGIYALERIARDSVRDHPTVMEVLAGFIREHLHDDVEVDEAGAVKPRKHPLRTDLRAALTVIGRRLVEQDLPGGIDLTGANLGRANLTNANLSGVNLIGANLTRADLTEANLHLADLTDANLTEANLHLADLTDANLTRADLTNANLHLADLTDANLTRADLTNANLHLADLIGTDLIDANLIGIDLTGANLTRANLTRANLTRADLSDANLTDTDLIDAELTDAELRLTELTDTDLTRANLTRADLTGANLTRANLTDVRFPGRRPTEAILGGVVGLPADWNGSEEEFTLE